MLDVKFSRIATDITSQISLTLKNLVPDHSLTCGNHILIVSISFFSTNSLGTRLEILTNDFHPATTLKFQIMGYCIWKNTPLKK